MSLIQRKMEEIDRVVEAGPYKPAIRSLEKQSVPDWYIDGKFGIFIHWGLYAVPAFKSEWYAREMYEQGSSVYEHHLKTYGKHKDFGYKDFIPGLTGERFDAAEWAGIFRKSGAKFVVPVAEHHDGFAMYASELNRWNTKDMGPKRDVAGELGKAVRNEGMVFGLSSHRAEHYWFFDQGLKFDSGIDDSEYADLYGPIAEDSGFGTRDTWNHKIITDEIARDWLAKTCEFVDLYQPQLVWFDWYINNPTYREYVKTFAAYYYNRGVEWGLPVSINYKFHALTPQSAVFDIERGQLDDIYPCFWQNDTGISKSSWGYTEPQEWKTAHWIIADIIDVVSKNGSMLLNIGPKADGTIPQEEIDLLLEIGKWLEVNGEAIYNTRPWIVYGEGPTKVAKGTFTDTKRAEFTAGDIRFTTHDDTLYAMPLARPEDGTIRICNLSAVSPYSPLKIESVELLGHGPVKWSQDADSMTIQLPAGRQSPVPCAVKIT